MRYEARSLGTDPIWGPHAFCTGACTSLGCLSRVSGRSQEHSPTSHRCAVRVGTRWRARYVVVYVISTVLERIQFGAKLVLSKPPPPTRRVGEASRNADEHAEVTSA